MTIPSADSYSGWKKGLYLTVKGVEFKMIPVEGLSSGFYLIGETEITESLFDRVMGNSSTSTSQYPENNLFYTEFISFISTLNSLTGLSFTLPTKEQWLYAAKGGKYSMGFTYSGSNNPDDVAWYSSNSGSLRHQVKLKSPNELGIYDMSGNVEEYVLKEKSSSYYYWYYMCRAFFSRIARSCMMSGAVPS